MPNVKPTEAFSQDSPRPPDLERTLDEITALLRRSHGPLIRRDRKAFRSSFVRGINRRFPLPTGRPRSAQLDHAEKLRAQGKNWNDICLQIEPHYKDWETFRRQVFRQKVQAGLRGRRKERKKLRGRKRRE